MKPHTSSDNTKRVEAILGRWSAVVAYGAIGACVWWVSAPLLADWVSPVVARLGATTPGITMFMIVVLAAPFAWSMGKGRWAGCLGVRYMHTYPPLWVSVVIGVLAACILNSISTVSLDLSDLCDTSMSIPPKYTMILGVLVAAGILLTLYIGLRSNKKKTVEPLEKGGSNDDGARLPKELSEFKDILEWISDDREIDHPERDAFGLDVIARRIARRLVSTGSGETPTIAIVGPTGSGKTSIGKLVEHHLITHARTRFVLISIWPFDSPGAAVRGILDRLIKELSLHVNTLSIGRLPEKYITAIESSGGRWSSTFGALCSSDDPETILEQTSKILIATNLRVVLWIDDLDRFGGIERDQDEQTRSADEDRMRPIRALLYLLDRMQHVSVIVADTTLESRFDVDKIARFVERIPRIDVERIWPPLLLLRNECLSESPEDIIDPVSKKQRTEFGLLNATTIRLGRMMRYEHNPKPAEAIVELLGSPRTLKQALRLTVEVWKHLAGEIDFDDVLMMSTIRIARPDLFSFVDRRIDVFRSGFKQHLAEAKPTEHPIFKAYEQLLSREQDDDTRRSIDTLMRLVFPEIPSTGGYDHDVGRNYIGRPQGLSVDRHVDYWSRYLSVPNVPKAVCDQAALKAIRSWQSNGGDDLIDRVLDKVRGDQIETFVEQFNRTDLCRLLSDVALKQKATIGPAFSMDVRRTGILSVWRMILAKTPSEQSLADTLERILPEILSVNFSLAYDLYAHFIKSPTQHRRPLVNQEQHDHLVSLIHGNLVACFPADAATLLLGALRGADHYVLRNLCIYCRPLVSHAGDQLPFDGWPQFADTLITACETDCQITVPQLLPFITESKEEQRVFDRDDEPHRIYSYTATFDEERAGKLFDLDKLIDVLRHAAKPYDLDESLSACFDAAKEFASAPDREPAQLQPE